MVCLLAEPPAQIALDARLNRLLAGYKWLAGEPFVDGNIPFCRLDSQCVGHSRRFTVAAIAKRGVMQTHKFLIKVIRFLTLCMPGWVAVGQPEAARIGGMHLVD